MWTQRDSKDGRPAPHETGSPREQRLLQRGEGTRRESRSFWLREGEGRAPWGEASGRGFAEGRVPDGRAPSRPSPASDPWCARAHAAL